MIPKLNIKSIIKKALSNATLTNVFIVGLTTVLVRSTGFFKEIVIADRFGLSELLDTFYIAVLIPTFINGVFLSSFKSVFIPNYVKELKENKNIGNFQSTSFLITIGVSLFFILIAILFTDVYLETFFKGHTVEYYALIKRQFYFVMPCILFWGFSSVLNGLLTIDNEFTFSSISSVFIPITIIICLVFFKETLGDVVLAVGTLIGSTLSFLFLLLITLNRKILNLKKPDFNSKNIIEVFKQLPAKVSSGLLIGVNPLIDQFFSAQLIVGSIAALNYGAKIPAFSMGIFGIAIGSVLLPYFSKKAVDNIKDSFITMQRILKYLIFGSTILIIIIILFSQPLIRLFFERNAFTGEDTMVVAKIQQMYLLQIPFYISALVVVKFLTSINKNNFMVLASLLSLIFNLVFNYILMKTMGVYGLALATSIVAFINFTVLYWYVIRLKNNYLKTENEA